MNNWLDASSTSNKYRQMYIKGFLDVSGGNIILRNNHLFVNSGDASLNGKLFTSKDASFNSNLRVGDTATIKTLFVTGDVSMNGNVFINFKNNSISPDAIIGGIPASTGTFNVDMSLNQRLSVQGDINARANLYVNNSIYENGVALINKYAPIGAPTFTGTTTLSTASISNNLLVSKDASLNGNLYVVGDATFTNRMYVGASISEGGVLLSNKYATIVSPSFTGTPTAPTASSSTNTTQVATTQFVTTKINNILDNVQGNLSTLNALATAVNFDPSFSYNVLSQLAGKVSIANPEFIGTASAGKLISSGDISGVRLLATGDSSFNGNLRVGQTIFEGGSSLISKYARLISPTFTGTATIPTGNLTTLNVAGDTSMNGNVVIGRNLTILGNIAVQNYTNQNIINTTTTNYQLIVSEDLSLNGRLVASGDSSFNGNIYTTGFITTTTQSITDNSNRAATTSYVRNLLDTSLNNALALYSTKSIIDSSLALYSRKSIIDASLALYSTKAIVDASLALYSTKAIVDASLALYSTKSIVDSSFALYSTKSIIDASLDLYSTKSIIDASLALYSTKSIVDASLALYSTKAIIDASLALYSTKSIIDASFALYSTKSVIDASLDLYSTKSTVDASLALYSTKSIVDVSLALKSNIANPTFTGVATIPNANITNAYISGDASMNSRLYINGDVSMNNLLDLSGSLIAHNNVNVYGIINQYTTTLDQGYIVNYNNISGNGDITANGILLQKTGTNQNTAYGISAANSLTTGANNTIIGYNSGATLQSGSNNIIIGSNATSSTASISNEITLGNNSISVLRCQANSITTLSDLRDKKNIEEIPVGLNFINEITPVKFDWNTRDGSKVNIADFGFIAQDLQNAETTVNIKVPHLIHDNNPDKLEASYGALIPIMVKAIKELSEITANQQEEINTLKQLLGL
ncbi:MAG: tail fiber domain-containing protein [Alphaproteobacteria bacterium]|nr:tail fiber domain-containing protein [Alphaproteobacteria bacterium]